MLLYQGSYDVLTPKFLFRSLYNVLKTSYFLFKGTLKNFMLPKVLYPIFFFKKMLEID